MKPPNHKYLFFTESHSYLFFSLQRYFKCILNLKLNPFSQTDLLTSTALLIYQEEKENPELLKILSNHKNIKIILLGFDNNCTINLLDFTNLKNNFTLKLSEDSSSTTQLFTEDELKEKLKNFFHTHGEDSLLEKLNWVKYYLSNGPRLLQQNEISLSDYKEKFFKTGKQYWNSFVGQVNQYEIYFQILGLKVEIDEVISLQDQFAQFVVVLENYPQHSGVHINEPLIKKNIDLSKIIEQILIKIKKDLNIGVSGFQNPGSRR